MAENCAVIGVGQTQHDTKRIDVSQVGLVREAALRAHDLAVVVDKVVRFGRRLDDVRRLIEERSVDLVVLNTKDADQSAMHGLAYPLAVELRTVPLLLL